jgi:hypothetical protein
MVGSSMLTLRERFVHFFAGKVFYLELEGEGQHAVLHFGMTGMLQVDIASLIS